MSKHPPMKIIRLSKHFDRGMFRKEAKVNCVSGKEVVADCPVVPEAPKFFVQVTRGLTSPKGRQISVGEFVMIDPDQAATDDRLVLVDCRLEPFMHQQGIRGVAIGVASFD